MARRGGWSLARRSRLSLLDERPYGEIAEELRISEGYVRVLLHRAREHVRKCEL